MSALFWNCALCENQFFGGGCESQPTFCSLVCLGRARETLDPPTRTIWKIGEVETLGDLRRVGALFLDALTLQPRSGATGALWLLKRNNREMFHWQVHYAVSSARSHGFGPPNGGSFYVNWQPRALTPAEASVTIEEDEWEWVA